MSSREEDAPDRVRVEHVTLAGRRWHRCGEYADALGSDSRGVWLVQTQGTRYVWDCGRRTFCRLPGAGARAGAMAHDGVILAIGRVQVYPAVGGRLWVWFDEPHRAGPALVEHYRVSSAIASITRISWCSCP